MTGVGSQRPLRLHLGCGKRYFPGFVHVDLDDFPHIDYRHDISRLPMFENDSADLIYSCGAFVYFDRIQAPAVLEEWRRVLKPGGILRLAVPDFEVLTHLYLKTHDLASFIGPLFGRWPISTEHGEQVLYQKTTYDFESLRRVLESAGFPNVRRYDWRTTEHSDIDDYSQAYIPHMDKEHGTLISLNVEASKGVR